MQKEEKDKIIAKLKEYDSVLPFYPDVADWDLYDILVRLEDSGLLTKPK